MRRHRAAEQALRDASAHGGLFEDAKLLNARNVGNKSVNGFLAAGWIEVVRDIGFRRLLRLTIKGRSRLAVLAAHRKPKKAK